MKNTVESNGSILIYSPEWFCFHATREWEAANKRAAMHYAAIKKVTVLFIQWKMIIEHLYHRLFVIFSNMQIAFDPFSNSNLHIFMLMSLSASHSYRCAPNWFCGHVSWPDYLIRTKSIYWMRLEFKMGKITRIHSNVLFMKHTMAIVLHWMDVAAAAAAAAAGWPTCLCLLNTENSVCSVYLQVQQSSTCEQK